jgi:hypothetical protein
MSLSPDRTEALLEKLADIVNPGKILGAPFTGITGGIADVLFGGKDSSGSRLRPVGSGPSGVKEISKAEYKKALKGNHNFLNKNTVTTGVIDGKKVFYRRLQRPGGMVGMAMKHPLLTTAGLGIGYLTLKGRPDAATRAQMAEQQRQGTAFKSPTKDYVKDWKKELSYENPMASKVWG